MTKRASSTRCGEFQVLAPDLYVETLRAADSVCNDHEIGEIVVSGGRNPFLPLLRYRNGNFARLETMKNGRRILRNFAGCAPVLFHDGKNEVISSIDVASVSRPYATTVFAFSQARNGDTFLRLPRAFADEKLLCYALQKLFGARSLTIVCDDQSVTKTVYSSEL